MYGHVRSISSRHSRAVAGRALRAIYYNNAMSNVQVSEVCRYFDTDEIQQGVENGEHRKLIGGMWDEIGELQLSVLKAHGLESHHTLLDIGCGSLRGGIRFIDYLNPENYFGLDISQSLLDAGYEVELRNAGLQHKLPRENLVCDADFDFRRFPFGQTFDFALALSVFTHLPLNHFHLCLERLRPSIKDDGRFFATYFELSPGSPLYRPQVHQPGGVTTFATKDPYHYRSRDLRSAALNLGWAVEEIKDFDHPRAQKLLMFSPGNAPPPVSALY